MFKRLRIDPYLIAILLSVGAAFLLPVSGEGAAVFSLVVKFAVGLLFFLYGARLAREAVIAGLLRWRLHLLILAMTFALFPAIGLTWGFAPDWLVAPPLVAGLTFLCCLPSTMQSSVALVASARGDVAAAVCSASASNLIGVVLTPVLVALMMHTQGVHVSATSVRDIVVQLLLPFVLGQFAHPWLGKPLARFKTQLGLYDRFTIMLVVYSAFSAAVIGGTWKQVPPAGLAMLFVICLALAGGVMFLGTRAARALGFAVEDEIVVAFCGTQKGIAAGVPMAALLFPPAQVGLMVLPLLIYHPLQLILCAIVSGRYGRRQG